MPGLHYCVNRSSVHRGMDRTQLLKGALDAATLAVVAEEDAYGYDVVRRLRAAGLAEVGDASVYGTLRRLYGAGALTSYVLPSDEGPHRRYYGITDRGRTQLEEARGTWAHFCETLTNLLERPQGVHA
jgi:PadR family transcriptional regulator, regulatory protein PadR